MNPESQVSSKRPAFPFRTIFLLLLLTSDLQQLCFQFVFHTSHICLCCLTFLTAFLLDLHHIIQCLDQFLIGFFQSFNIYNTSLGLLCSFHRCQVKRFRIFLQKFISKIRNLPLCLCGFCGVRDPRASTIWLFQRGMVFTIVVWIFSTILVSLFWIRRI